MTTPTEDEARARIVAKLDRIPDSYAVTLDKDDVRALLASRVSTPPSEPRPSPISGEYVAGPMGQAIRESTATSGSTAYPDALGYVEQTIYANEDSSPSVTWTNAEVLEMLGDIADRLTVTARATPPTDEDERDQHRMNSETRALIEKLRVHATVIPWLRDAADALEASAVPATPPTDEDERDEIATIVDDVMEAARRRGDVATPYEISGVLLAAGFRRQVPSTPDEEVRDAITHVLFLTGGEATAEEMTRELLAQFTVIPRGEA